jgi:hypothetical protein
MLFAAALCLARAVATTKPYTPPVTKGLAKLEEQILPGGAVHDLYYRLVNKPYNTTHPSSGWRGPVKTLPDGTFEQTFLSAPMVLKGGEISNEYQPVHWPEGHVAIKAFTGDVVKLKPGAALEPNVYPEVVPSTRDETYFHHWTFNHWQVNESKFEALANGAPFDENDITIALRDAGQNTGMQGPCMGGLLHFRFGGGNELRGAAPGQNYSYELPDPYAFESNSDVMDRNGLIWLVNSHLIDVRGVSDADFRGCTECQCNVTGGHPKVGGRYTGGLGCCHSTTIDGARCPVAAAHDDAIGANTYFFQHTLKWKGAWDVTDQHVEVITLDVSDNGPAWSGFPYAEGVLPGHYAEGHAALKADNMSMASLATQHSGVSPSSDMCHVEYYIPPCNPTDAADDCVHTFNNSWALPFPGVLVGSYSHFHSGALSQSTYTENALICRSPPVLDSKGRINFIPRCLAGEECKEATCGLELPTKLGKGDKIYVETKYKQDALPHYGAMGFSILMIHRTDYDN